MKLLIFPIFVFLLKWGCLQAIEDIDAVRQARLQQNAAMAAGDVERVASYWMEDVTLRRGLGTSTIGKKAYRALIDPRPNERSIVYVREPELIEVSQHWPLAYESGIWTAHLGCSEGPVLVEGRYSAHWVKRDEQWFIRAEVFVALQCWNEGCAWLAEP